MTTRVHISLTVTDLDAAVAHYERLFGQPVTKRRPDYANFRLDEPPIHLALAPGAREKGTDRSHFGIELPDTQSLANWRRRLRDGDVGFHDEPGADCCYARGDKAWVDDPDGNRWEIWVRTGESARAAACC